MHDHIWVGSVSSGDVHMEEIVNMLFLVGIFIIPLSLV